MILNALLLVSLSFSQLNALSISVRENLISLTFFGLDTFQTSKDPFLIVLALFVGYVLYTFLESSRPDLVTFAIMSGLGLSLWHSKYSGSEEYGSEFHLMKKLGWKGPFINGPEFSHHATPLLGYYYLGQTTRLFELNQE